MFVEANIAGMVPDDTNDGTTPAYVVCASCGSKAPSSWSFCRSCSSSLDDAVPAHEAREDVRTENAPGRDSTGCPKCGHGDAEIDKIATTGTGLSMLLDLQNRQFNIVTCANCGYTEFYRGSDTAVMLDLFLG